MKINFIHKVFFLYEELKVFFFPRPSRNSRIIYFTNGRGRGRGFALFFSREAKTVGERNRFWLTIFISFFFSRNNILRESAFPKWMRFVFLIDGFTFCAVTAKTICGFQLVENNRVRLDLNNEYLFRAVLCTGISNIVIGL